MGARTPWTLAALCPLVMAAGCLSVWRANKGEMHAKGPAAGTTWTVPHLGLELAYVAPGTFLMGATTGHDLEKPVHPVQISRGFWMGTREVTQAEFRRFARATKYRTTAEQQGWSNAWTAGDFGRKETGASWKTEFAGRRRPAVCLSWHDAAAFCRWLTEREQAARRLPAGLEYRLPTEAEWEYAARGGVLSQGYTYSGSNTVDEVAWHYENSGDRRLDGKNLSYGDAASNHCRAHDVGGKKPNELGLYDLSGNALEWCYDWDGRYPAGTVTDPSGPAKGARRVIRGGSWLNPVFCCRVANRFSNVPSTTLNNHGFRLALAPTVRTTAP